MNRKAMLEFFAVGHAHLRLVDIFVGAHDRDDNADGRRAAHRIGPTPFLVERFLDRIVGTGRFPLPKRPPEATCVDTFGGAKPRFLNRGKKRRSVLTLSIPRPRPCHRPWQCWQSRQDRDWEARPRASARGVEWVDFFGRRFS